MRWAMHESIRCTTLPSCSKRLKDMKSAPDNPKELYCSSQVELPNRTRWHY